MQRMKMCRLISSLICLIFISHWIFQKKLDDLIYFVEDDYIHELNSISEMILTYERIASQISNELILCPTDYPYLYTKTENTNIFRRKKSLEKINETLCTFLTSKQIVEKHWLN